MSDALIQFLIEERGVRGAVVGIDSGLDAMFGARDYSPDVRRLVGEAAASGPLLASHLKFEGRINLQFQGQGALKLLVTQVDHRLKLRSMAKAEAGAAGSFAELAGGGRLALMLEPSDGLNRYQAMVPIEGEQLSQALEGYYAQSEQLPTRLLLASSPDRLAGILLQRLPGRDDEAAGEGWAHVGILLDTLTADELVRVPAEQLLRRLFHAETLRVFPPRPVTLACSCSRASISKMMLALGERELEPELRVHGRIAVTCEFCGQVYIYPEVEVRELFAASRAPGDGAVRH